MIFARLWLLFVVVPCVELGLLIWIGSRIGLGPALGIILLTGTVGAALARHQGLGALRRIQRAVAAGRMPATELADGVLILAAGLLLLTPGVLTDAAGFTLLIPPCRRLIQSCVHRRIRRHIQTVTYTDAETAEGQQRPEMVDVTDFELRD